MIEVEFFNHARLIYWKRDNGYKIASTFAGAGVLMSVENIRRAQQNYSTGHVKWPHVFSFFFFCVKFNLGLAWMGKKKIQSLITYLNIVKIFSKVFALWSKLKSIPVQKKKISKASFSFPNYSFISICAILLKKDIGLPLVTITALSMSSHSCQRV